MSDSIYDLIIIGGGPAGLSAGIYASRAKLNCILLEKMLPGGQMLLTDTIENFPGFSEAVTGSDLAFSMHKQALRCGLAVETGEITAIKHIYGKEHHFDLEIASGGSYKTLAIIAATGAKWKQLGIPGEAAFSGKGVSYCATCDGPLFKGKDVVVVGGGDKALEEALYLANIVKSVKLVHRRGRFRAVKELQKRVLSNGKITPIYDSVVAKIGGTNKVESVNVMNVKTEKTEPLPCNGVFIFIGITPNSGILRGLADMDAKGFVLADSTMKTSKPGIYACGDVIKKSLYQISTAVGEGATAAFHLQKHIDELKGASYI